MGKVVRYQATFTNHRVLRELGIGNLRVSAIGTNHVFMVSYLDNRTHG